MSSADEQEFQVSGIGPDSIDFMWEKVNRRIEHALGNDLTSCKIEEVYEDLLTGLRQLWVVHRGGDIAAVIVTQLLQSSEGSYLHVLALQGENMEKWLPLIDRALRLFAAAHACAFLEITGRRGWVKTLKPYAWQEIYVSMRRYL